MPTFPTDPDDVPPHEKPHVNPPKPDRTLKTVMWKGIRPIMPLRRGERIAQMIKFVTDQIPERSK